MIIDVLKNAIQTNLGPVRSAPNNWWKRNCMLCHSQGHGKDTRNRFGIQYNQNSIALNCFNCKFSAGYTEGKDLSKSFVFFLSQLSLDKKFVEQIKFEIFKQQNKISVVREGEDPNGIDRLKTLFDKWKPMELPIDALPIQTWLENGLDDPDFLNVTEYALNRKLLRLDEFYWSPSKISNMNTRLIIPYQYKNKIVGHTARLIYESEDKAIPKYLQHCPLGFVYNLDNNNDWTRKYVIVAEGVLDAWAIDGISTLGEINQDQIDIINRLQKDVIVTPDGDKSGKGLVNAAIQNNWAVSFPKWKKTFKDAAAAAEKYGSLLALSSIISSAVTGELKIESQWTIDQNERNKIKKYDRE